MICIVIPGPTQEAVQQQIEQANGIGDLLECRIDLWDPFEISPLLKLCKIPILLTLRTISQGGKAEVTLKEYEDRLQDLVSLRPAYIDIESDKDIQINTHGVKVILSYHNYKETPSDLPLLLQKMNQKPADLYKIAVQTHTTSDALRIMRDLQGSNLIALGMGPYGAITRITQPIFNSGITYALLPTSECTASGQLTVNELTNRYHYRTLNPLTSLYAIIGDPLDKSLGHFIHNQGFVKNGINALYLKIRVKPNELKECMELFKNLHFQGFSVTMPLKEVILPLLNKISPEAQAINAVNTLKANEGGWEGSNTDAVGAIDAIDSLVSVKGKKIVILGIGGASKAASYEAERRGASVRKLSRSLNNLGDIGNDYDILINATPSPMPIEPDHILPNKIVMDMVTRPKLTPFLQEAQSKSCRLVYGYQMWVNQACTQWRTWFPKLEWKGQKAYFLAIYEDLS